MKKLSAQVALGLGLSMMLGLSEKVFAGDAINTNINPSKPQLSSSPQNCNNLDQGKQASETIQLYYIHSVDNSLISDIKNILQGILNQNPTCWQGSSIGTSGNNLIVVYGNPNQRKELKRIIATLDFPRERVNLAMWGIQISSNNPEQLAKVVRRVNQEINNTQRLIQDTYKEFQSDAREIVIDPVFQKLLKQLNYHTALDEDRPSLSMIDILLLISAAKKPVENYNLVAEKLCRLFQEEQYKPYVAALDQEKRPFGNYFIVGLHQQNFPDSQSSSNLKQDCKGNIPPYSKKVLQENLWIRETVLDFALQYSDLIQRPDMFSPESLQQSTEDLNSRLNPIVDAINLDVEELFIEPTLKKIQEIVKEYKHVEYAEVGKTSLAGLNGIQSKVSSTPISAFDETPPLRLSDLLTQANAINPTSQTLLPSTSVNFGSTVVPIASVVDLIAALSQDRSSWRTLTSGVSLTITPNVLRNNQSAELAINFSSGPPSPSTLQAGVRPLSQITNQNLTTNAYVNALDLFTLSTFNNQVTIDGGRTYLPFIGTIWQGIFSDIPILGNLFSWKNHPKNVQYQSIVLINSFIVPTAIGLAPLYQPDQPQGDTSNLFNLNSTAVENYKINRKHEIEEEGKFSGE
jgi:hypothetical protein